MKYRKRPVAIEAIQYLGDDLTEMINAWGADFQRSVIEQVRGSHLIIFTLEGNHRADVGDFIIKGVAGEFYPCKPDIFMMTYEEAQ